MMREVILALATLPVLAVSAPRLRSNVVFAPKCWAQQPDIIPAVFAACRILINRIPTSSSFEPDVPLKFSPDPSYRPDIRLPAVWGQGSKECTIGLQFDPDQGGYDRTTLLDIQAAALATAFRCVINPPHMGGTVEVGWQRRMVVNVLALKDPDSRPHAANITLSTEQMYHEEDVFLDFVGDEPVQHITVFAQ